MGCGQILTLKNDPTCILAPRIFINYKLHWDGVGQSLTLKNDCTCSLATRVVLKHIGVEWDSILTSKNKPICSLAQRVVMKYKLHLGGAGSNLNVEK